MLGDSILNLSEGASLPGMRENRRERPAEKIVVAGRAGRCNVVAPSEARLPREDHRTAAEVCGTGEYDALTAKLWLVSTGPPRRIPIKPPPQIHVPVQLKLAKEAKRQKLFH